MYNQMAIALVQINLKQYLPAFVDLQSINMFKNHLCVVTDGKQCGLCNSGLNCAQIFISNPIAL